jgi:hypothetical protein
MAVLADPLASPSERTKNRETLLKANILRRRIAKLTTSLKAPEPG